MIYIIRSRNMKHYVMKQLMKDDSKTYITSTKENHALKKRRDAKF